jgi:hypothetical protein
VNVHRGLASSLHSMAEHAASSTGGTSSAAAGAPYSTFTATAAPAGSVPVHRTVYFVPAVSQQQSAAVALPGLLTVFFATQCTCACQANRSPAPQDHTTTLQRHDSPAQLPPVQQARTGAFPPGQWSRSMRKPHFLQWLLTGCAGLSHICLVLSCRVGGARVDTTPNTPISRNDTYSTSDPVPAVWQRSPPTGTSMQDRRKAEFSSISHQLPHPVSVAPLPFTNTHPFQLRQAHLPIRSLKGGQARRKYLGTTFGAFCDAVFFDDQAHTAYQARPESPGLKPKKVPTAKKGQGNEVEEIDPTLGGSAKRKGTSANVATNIPFTFGTVGTKQAPFANGKLAAALKEDTPASSSSFASSKVSPPSSISNTSVSSSFNARPTTILSLAPATPDEILMVYPVMKRALSASSASSSAISSARNSPQLTDFSRRSVASSGATTAFARMRMMDLQANMLDIPALAGDREVYEVRPEILARLDAHELVAAPMQYAHLPMGVHTAEQQFYILQDEGWYKLMIETQVDCQCSCGAVATICDASEDIFHSSTPMDHVVSPSHQTAAAAAAAASAASSSHGIANAHRHSICINIRFGVGPPLSDFGQKAFSLDSAALWRDVHHLKLESAAHGASTSSSASSLATGTISSSTAHARRTALAKQILDVGPLPSSWRAIRCADDIRPNSSILLLRYLASAKAYEVLKAAGVETIQQLAQCTIVSHRTGEMVSSIVYVADVVLCGVSLARLQPSLSTKVDQFPALQHASKLALIAIAEYQVRVLSHVVIPYAVLHAPASQAIVPKRVTQSAFVRSNDNPDDMEEYEQYEPSQVLRWEPEQPSFPTKDQLTALQNGFSTLIPTVFNPNHVGGGGGGSGYSTPALPSLVSSPAAASFNARVRAPTPSSSSVQSRSRSSSMDLGQRPAGIIPAGTAAAAALVGAANHPIVVGDLAPAQSPAVRGYSDGREAKRNPVKRSTARKPTVRVAHRVAASSPQQQQQQQQQQHPSPVSPFETPLDEDLLDIPPAPMYLLDRLRRCGMFLGPSDGVQTATSSDTSSPTSTQLSRTDSSYGWAAGVFKRAWRAFAGNFKYSTLRVLALPPQDPPAYVDDFTITHAEFLRKAGSVLNGGHDYELRQDEVQLLWNLISLPFKAEAHPDLTFSTFVRVYCWLHSVKRDDDGSGAAMEDDDPHSNMTSPSPTSSSSSSSSPANCSPPTAIFQTHAPHLIPLRPLLEFLQIHYPWLREYCCATDFSLFATRTEAERDLIDYTLGKTRNSFIRLRFCEGRYDRFVQDEIESIIAETTDASSSDPDSPQSTRRVRVRELRTRRQPVHRQLIASMRRVQKDGEYAENEFVHHTLLVVDHRPVSKYSADYVDPSRRQVLLLSLDGHSAQTDFSQLQREANLKMTLQMRVREDELIERVKAIHLEARELKGMRRELQMTNEDSAVLHARKQAQQYFRYHGAPFTPPPIPSLSSHPGYANLLHANYVGGVATQHLPQQLLQQSQPLPVYPSQLVPQQSPLTEDDLHDDPSYKHHLKQQLTRPPMAPPTPFAVPSGPFHAPGSIPIPEEDMVMLHQRILDVQASIMQEYALRYTARASAGAASMYSAPYSLPVRTAPGMMQFTPFPLQQQQQQAEGALSHVMYGASIPNLFAPNRHPPPSTAYSFEHQPPHQLEGQLQAQVNYVLGYPSMRVHAEQRLVDHMSLAAQDAFTSLPHHHPPPHQQVDPYSSFERVAEPTRNSPALERGAMGSSASSVELPRAGTSMGRSISAATLPSIPSMHARKSSLPMLPMASNTAAAPSNAAAAASFAVGKREKPRKLTGIRNEPAAAAASSTASRSTAAASIATKSDASDTAKKRKAVPKSSSSQASGAGKAKTVLDRKLKPIKQAAPPVALPVDVLAIVGHTSQGSSSESSSVTSSPNESMIPAPLPPPFISTPTHFFAPAAQPHPQLSVSVTAPGLTQQQQMVQYAREQITASIDRGSRLLQTQQPHPSTYASRPSPNSLTRHHSVLSPGVLSSPSSDRLVGSGLDSPHSTFHPSISRSDQTPRAKRPHRRPEQHDTPNQHALIAQGGAQTLYGYGSVSAQSVLRGPDVVAPLHLSPSSSARRSVMSDVPRHSSSCSGSRVVHDEADVAMDSQNSRTRAGGGGSSMRMMSPSQLARIEHAVEASQLSGMSDTMYEPSNRIDHADGESVLRPWNSKE